MRREFSQLLDIDWRSIMGCPSDVDLGANLVFSVTTHDADTGVLTDADGDPTYRIYEDETAVPILTGTMSNLDDANTTGFYTELIACTAANGFEDGKTYTIYIEATVDADRGGITFAFTAVEKFVEGSLTEYQVLRAMLAGLGGTARGGGTDTLTFRDNADSKNRITAVVNENGNRISVALDVS